MPRMADVLQMLRTAAAEFGAETPIQRIPLDRDTADPTVDQSSYTATTLNPAIGGSPNALLLTQTPNGCILSVVAKGDTDVHRRSQRKMYARRNKKWRETGSDEGRSTDQLQDNPNEHLITPTTTSTQEIDNG